MSHTNLLDNRELQIALLQGDALENCELRILTSHGGTLENHFKIVNCELRIVNSEIVGGA